LKEGDQALAEAKKLAESGEAALEEVRSGHRAELSEMEARVRGVVEGLQAKVARLEGEAGEREDELQRVKSSNEQMLVQLNADVQAITALDTELQSSVGELSEAKSLSARLAAQVAEATERATRAEASVEEKGVELDQVRAALVAAEAAVEEAAKGRRAVEESAQARVDAARSASAAAISDATADITAALEEVQREARMVASDAELCADAIMAAARAVATDAHDHTRRLATNLRDTAQICDDVATGRDKVRLPTHPSYSDMHPSSECFRRGVMGRWCVGRSGQRTRRRRVRRQR
jgi:DNA repair exonuclease SbcCD ATPase subunit